MTRYLFFTVLLAMQFSCNNSTETKTTGNGEKDTSINIPEPARDYHTKESDVIENFFIFINNRDWTTANGFYADSISISNRSVFFRNILEDNKYVRLNLGAITPLRGELHVHTTAVKADGSPEESCFRFRIENLKIVSQMKAPCIQ